MGRAVRGANPRSARYSVIFHQTKLAGAWILEPERKSDDRGFFARVWCQNELRAKGLSDRLVQSSISFNSSQGTLRGMHWQEAPHEEIKIVRCTMGAIHDVIIDLRRTSVTYKQHFGIDLTSENRLMLYIPEGFAHGFLTLTDNCEILYQMSEFYVPESQRGLRYNDPAFNINWPQPVRVISDRDRTVADFTG